MNWSDVLNAQMMGQQPQNPMAPQGPAPFAPGAGPRRPMPPMGGQPPMGPPPPTQGGQIAKVPGADISADQRNRMDLYTRLAGLGGMERKMTQQQALANELRQGGEMPGMRGGGQYAAHPLEFLASTVSDIGGSLAGKQARGTEDEYNKQRAAQLARYRESMGFLPDVAG